MTVPRFLETMLRLALPRLILLRVLVAQSAAREHCSCHSVKSKTFTRLMFERGFRAAAAHRAPSKLDCSCYLRSKHILSILA